MIQNHWHIFVSGGCAIIVWKQWEIATRRNRLWTNPRNRLMPYWSSLFCLETERLLSYRVEKIKILTKKRVVFSDGLVIYRFSSFFSSHELALPGLCQTWVWHCEKKWREPVTWIVRRISKFKPLANMRFLDLPDRRRWRLLILVKAVNVDSHFFNITFTFYRKVFGGPPDRLFFTGSSFLFLRNHFAKLWRWYEIRSTVFGFFIKDIIYTVKTVKMRSLNISFLKLILIARVVGHALIELYL